MGMAISSTGFILAFILNHYYLEAERKRNEPKFDATEFVQKIERVKPSNRIKVLKTIKEFNDVNLIEEITLLDQTGKKLFHANLGFSGDFPPPPRSIQRNNMPQGGPPQGAPGGPPGAPPSRMARQDRANFPPSRANDGRRTQVKTEEFDEDYNILRKKLAGEPRHEIIIKARKSFGPRRKGLNLLLLRFILIEILGMSLGVGLTFYIIFTHFKKRTEEIEVVLNSIRKGDLKSRMPVETGDEFGLAMKNFNIMADEIENLVGKLRNAENTRRVLLGELAHDIRTPLASVRNFIEIIQTREDKLTTEKKQEVLGICQQEIEYMTRLVDDLLFLGKIEEPSYRKIDESINYEEVISTTADNLKRIYPGVKFELKSSVPEERLVAHMDSTLTARLFRNVMDNAFSFAKNKVECYVQENDGNIRISIRDDGPGFHPSSLESFGVKKFSREDRSRIQTKRISIGLGSVIMKRIVELYHGKFGAQNIESKKGQIIGGEVSFEFPLNKEA